MALVSGFVHGTGASSSSLSSMSTFESAVGDEGVGVSLVVAGDARDEAFGPGEADGVRPDGLCFPAGI